MAGMDLPIPTDLVPLAGGFSGETFVAGEGSDRVVVRIYAARSARRGPRAVDVDSALLRLMRGVVPVPEVLEVRRPHGDLPGLLVTGFLPGERGDLLLARLDPAGRATVGTALGRILDRLAHVPTLRGGEFTDGELHIEPFAGAADGLPGWVAAHRGALSRWDPAELAGLDRLADKAQGLLDAVDRTCVVHSDLNPKNVLIDPRTLEVTGLLDWEFAHSGSPYTDVGNLLRFERDEPFTTAVLAEWGDLDLARAADLYALVDLAARDHEPDVSNPVTSAADALLRAMAASGDLHAGEATRTPSRPR